MQHFIESAAFLAYAKSSLAEHLRSIKSKKYVKYLYLRLQHRFLRDRIKTTFYTKLVGK